MGGIRHKPVLSVPGFFHRFYCPSRQQNTDCQKGAKTQSRNHQTAFQQILHSQDLTGNIRKDQSFSKGIFQDLIPQTNRKQCSAVFSFLHCHLDVGFQGFFFRILKESPVHNIHTAVCIPMCQKIGTAYRANLFRSAVKTQRHLRDLLDGLSPLQFRRHTHKDKQQRKNNPQHRCYNDHIDTDKF